jgi:hypothetical protein
MQKKITLFLLILIFSISAKSQITWNMGMNIASSASGNEHPRVVTDGSGHPLVLWGHSAKAMLSRWNGTSFTTPVMLNPMSMTIAEASWMGPDIASHGDIVYIVFKQTPEMDTSSHIYIVRSFDGGVTFSLPFQVDFIADSVSRFPTVTTDVSGNPIVGFIKFDPNFLNARWVVTKSTDFGNTFSTDVKASGWSTVGSTVCDCCPGSIVCEGNTVAMLYRDNNSNIRDSWAGVSYNNGTSFSNGWNLDQNNWNLFSCPSTGSDAIINGDSLYAVFMNGASGINRVYFSASSLSNAIAQPSQLLTGSLSGLNQQNYPRIDKSGNAMAIAWKQNINGSDQLPLLFTSDISNGFPAIYDTVDLNDITNADVALSNGNIFVIWEDDNSGTVKFRSGTFIPVNTSVNEITENNLSFFPNPAKNFLNLNLSLKQPSVITIYNSFGQEVIIKNFQGNLKTETISTVTLANGIYFWEIKSNDKNISNGKLVILK